MAVDIYDELELLRTSIAQANAEAAAVRTALGALTARVAALEPKPLRLAPVTYFRSTTAWDTALAAKPALVLINPGSGPGLSPDALYVGLVPKCRAAGVPVYGYVHTRYAVRPAAEVKADVLNHKAWYGVNGIFVDTVSAKAEHLPYYADLCAFIKVQGLKVCLNPGTNGPEQHAQLADYVMVAENYWANYKTQARPTWESKPEYRGKLWHVVHSCPEVEVPAAVALAKQRGAGLVYVTDDLMPNPYDRLPAYTAALVAAIEAA